jgi:hypothetical protein
MTSCSSTDLFFVLPYHANSVLNVVERWARSQEGDASINSMCGLEWC